MLNRICECVTEDDNHKLLTWGNNLMFHKKNPEEILVDVIALSSKKCEVPIRVKLRFATDKNFMGTPIDGYKDLKNPREICLLSKKAAHDLCNVQNYLSEKGYCLYLYDAYCPQRAVTHFWQWSQSSDSATPNELVRKSKHYPLIPKEKFFELGYVAKNSSHCYGNTLDTEIVNLKTNKPIFMGARISYMGSISHSTATIESIQKEWSQLKEHKEFDDIKKQLKRATGETWDNKEEDNYAKMAVENRGMLSGAMEKFNFFSYEKEWWHYSHKERESKDPIDLPISSKLKGLGVT